MGILLLVIAVLALLAMGMFLWSNTATPEEAKEDKGTTDTMPADRFLNIEGLRNARQLGGYIGADSRAIKKGLLLRTERSAVGGGWHGAVALYLWQGSNRHCRRPRHVRLGRE